MKYSMFIGRWQPWHNGHRWLIDQRLSQNKNVLICVREVSRDDKNPYDPEEVKKEIENELIRISDDSFKPIILRLATLYGLSSRLRFDLVLNMFAGMAYVDRKIVLNSTGDSWRPVVHINDVVKAITMCIENDPINYSNHLNEYENSLILKLPKYFFYPFLLSNRT